jgi:hypothetical protein
MNKRFERIGCTSHFLPTWHAGARPSRAWDQPETDLTIIGNSNYAFIRRATPSYFVKLAVDQERRDTLAHEAAIYRLLELMLLWPK